MHAELTLVADAGVFIGGHLRRPTSGPGNWVRAVDIKPQSERYQQFPRRRERRRRSAAAGGRASGCVRGRTGSITWPQTWAKGLIEQHKVFCMLSALTNTHLLLAALHPAVSDFFYSSSRLRV